MFGIDGIEAGGVQFLFGVERIEQGAGAKLHILLAVEVEGLDHPGYASQRWLLHRGPGWFLACCSRHRWEELLVAKLDYEHVLQERHNMDFAGHYARPDVTRLVVDRRRQTKDSFQNEPT